MTHQLWQSEEGREAQGQEVIATMFNAPGYILPEDRWAIIKPAHPEAKELNLGGERKIPERDKKINKGNLIIKLFLVKTFFFQSFFHHVLNLCADRSALHLAILLEFS